MIEKTYRLEFLEAFLRLFKVVDVEYFEITSEKVVGCAIYDSIDPEEKQDFCWTIREDDVPPVAVMEIIKVITENDWCDIDKITISENELFDEMGWKDRSLFDTCFNMLFEIEIRMIDDGKETDSFFVHT